ncbi:hypothetical protein AB670_03339 [Chryseobacterium sp. MOF25P]|uniref:hypothetical protein n=1 Tax=unclassified Chryseobacterium TaxID=2593645 RepID=UPI000805443E|nr:MULTISPECIES: hypothetical protein [unclassified Chryseobacterium]OBW40328.1 hypothetical protein AB670_03339 [Chryseobacterium sp. MOF25P]OBW45890.1 hypothetical protein AB671_02007 [Chryseobacterium sp. BGARF1]
MEILFYGNGKRMIKYYSLIIICLLVLSGLNLYYLPNFKLLMLVVLVLILVYFAIVVKLVFGKFIESGLNDIFSTEFNRMRTFIFLGIFVMIYISFGLLQEPILYISGFSLVYIQNSLAITGLAICVGLTDVMYKTITIDFTQTYDGLNNLNYTEVSNSDNKRGTLNIMYYCFANNPKEAKKGFKALIATSKPDLNDVQEYNIKEDKLIFLYDSLRKYEIIRDSTTYDFFKDSFLRKPIIVDMNYSDLYLFYKLFVETYSVKITMKKFCTFFLQNSSGVFDYATFRKEGRRQKEPRKTEVLEDIFDI